MHRQARSDQRCRPSNQRLVFPTFSCVALFALAVLVIAPKSFAFKILGIPLATSPSLNPESQPAIFVHWDLREFTDCKVPFAVSTSVVDLDGDGDTDDVDRGLATTAATAAMTSWNNCDPAVIVLFLQPAAPVANRAIRRDQTNVIDWGAGGTTDTAHPAPVGTAGLGNIPIIFPGANNALNSAPAAGDVFGILPDGTLVIASGADGDIDTTPAADDAWALGLALAANTNIVNPGDGVLDSLVFGDDAIAANVVNAGANGIVETFMNIQIGAAFGLTGIFANNQTGVIEEADILLQGDPANNVWRINQQDLINPAPTNIKDLQATLTHELGHAIGIAHTNDNQLVARRWGEPGSVSITPGANGVLEPATIAGLGGDDEIAGNQVFSGPNGISETVAAAGDTAVFPVNQGRPDDPAGDPQIIMAVGRGEDGVLEAGNGGDDWLDGNGDVRVGANGISESWLAIDQIPTMNQNTDPFLGSLEQQSLEIDDLAACNFLYTPDLGDAPDPWVGVFNEYQSNVHSNNPANPNPPASHRSLNGVALFPPALGPTHLFGYTQGDDVQVVMPGLAVGAGGIVVSPGKTGALESEVHGDDVVAGVNIVDGGNLIAESLAADYPNWFERLGPNEPPLENPSAECESNQVDVDPFDDGVFAPVMLVKGAPNPVGVLITHTSQAGRYAVGVATQRLYYNGYFDFPNNCVFDPFDIELWWNGSSTATHTASPNFVPPAAFGANRIVLNFNLDVPQTAADAFYARHRLDYGEDEGAVQNISGDNAPAQGAAQFGEVEDYYHFTSNEPFWRLTEGATYEHWALPAGNSGDPGEGDPVPAVADVFRNADGMPTLTVAGLLPGITDWLLEHAGRNGVWRLDIGTGGTLSFFIPNPPGPDVPPKDIWVHVVYLFGPPSIVVTDSAGDPAAPVGAPVITSLPDGWSHISVRFRIDFCPSFEFVRISPAGPTDPVLYVDQVTIDTICDKPIPPGIPTVSEWGLVVMVLLLLSAGTIVYRSRSTAVA